jgi:DNA-binding CsgD family transcriptional regulator
MTSETFQISDREREILKLVATGATNQQIAYQLNISVNTVKVHLRNIFGKIGATSRTEATIYAIQHGLVHVNRGTLDSTIDGAVIDGEVAPLALVDMPALEPPAVELPPSPQAELVAQRLEPLAVSPSISRRAPRRRWLMVLLTAISALVVFATVYLLTQTQQRPTTTETPQPGLVNAEGNRWKTRASLPAPRSNFAVAAYEGKLYVIGGMGTGGASSAVERYDPANDLWISLDDKPTAVTDVQAVTVGGRIYVPGGESQGGAILNLFEAYDPRSQRWESLPPLPAPRSRYALATTEGRIYLFGGWDGSSYHNDVFAYDPESKSWSSRAPMPTARRAAGAAVIDDRVYVIGGENASGPLRINERYDPAASADGQWDSRTPLPAASGTPAVAGIGSVGLLVFDPQLHTGLQYDPNKDAWSSIKISDGVALSARVAPLGVSVFVFGPAGAPPQTVGISEYKALYTTFVP